MREETKADREAQIATAAYAVLAEKGYGGASMLLIAKRANASNETLYRWYGDKAGLFRRLITLNAAFVHDLLIDAANADVPPLATLRALGPALLGLLTTDRAIALNRAAAADPSGVLGATLAEEGRGTIAPLIGDLLQRLDPTSGEDALGLYLDLLVGDLQIRRVIGAAPVLTDEACNRRAATALERYLELTS
ncbi:MAG: TetR/AcrR family transcriptional regulator [Pseudomonadota bacterium]